MKKIISLVIATVTVALFAGKKMIVHNAGTNYEIIVSAIDSITFVDVNIDAPAGMKLIPAKDSAFKMGLSNGHYSQQVSFTRDFYMDSTEVTQKDYNDLMTATYIGYSSPSWSALFGVGDNHPTYYVGWYDAVLYCNARSKAAGKDTVYTYTAITGTAGNSCELTNVAINYEANGFRLPTEAEWEYAARAGTFTDYYWGKDNKNRYPANVTDSTEVDSYAVWKRNSADEGSNSPDYGTHEVATKLPNSFGLYDMSGNVLEWCGDWYGNYSGSVVVDPTGATTGSDRVLRGGGWDSFASDLRSGLRQHRPRGGGYGNIGFRVVCPVFD